MKTLKWGVAVLFFVVLIYVEAKNCKITDVFHHKNGYSHQFVLHSACPLEHEPPSSITTASGKNEVRFFVPIRVKDESIKKNIQKINESAGSSYYSIRMNVKDKGVECVITLNADNLHAGSTAFELQKVKSITGKYGLLIKIHDSAALHQMVATSGNNRIKRLAYADKIFKPTIAIDYGHGGKDSGYYDKVTGLKEKDINYQIGSKVVGLLKKKIIRSV